MNVLKFHHSISGESQWLETLDDVINVNNIMQLLIDGTWLIKLLILLIKSVLHNEYNCSHTIMMTEGKVKIA